MKKKINYKRLFNDLYITAPKSLRGDNHNVKEIKIYEKYLYTKPKETKVANTFVKSETDTNNNGIKNHLSKIIDIEENPDEVDTQRNIAFKYTIFTNSSNFIQIPGQNEYHTNDKDLKTLIDLMNEPPIKEFGYSNVIDDKNCKVYKKYVEGNPVILIKCIAKIPYNKDIVFEAIANLDIRKKWDAVFSELRVVNYEGENGAEILYMIIKSPVFIVDDRDFVQQRKMWKNFPTDKSHILHFISFDTPSCPKNKKCVRAETIISGYYIQDDPENPENTILGILSQTDIKGNIPHFLVNKFAPKSSKKWIKSLIKGCEIVCNNL